MDEPSDIYFNVSGELLKLYLVLQSPKNGPPVKLAPKPPQKDDIIIQPTIGYHVDIRIRNPEDFTKTVTSPHSSTKMVTDSVMVSNPKHGYVRHIPKVNPVAEGTQTGTATNVSTATSDSDTASSSDPNTATSSTAASLNASSSSTTPASTSNNNNNNNDIPRGLLSEFVTTNSPTSAVSVKKTNKPNFFRFPDGTIVFPIEIPVGMESKVSPIYLFLLMTIIGVKSKFNNKDLTVVVSVARVMQPPPKDPTGGKAVFPDSLYNIPLPGLL